MFSISLQSTLLWFTAAAIVIITPLILWFLPPPLFNSAVVEIPRGSSVSYAAEKLADAGVVYTPEVVSLSFKLSDKNIVAGTYGFDTAESADSVVGRLSDGDFRIPQNSIVIPEGFTNEQIATRLEAVLDQGTFSMDAFLDQAEEHQGYLYPDTYYLHSNVTPSEIIWRMRDNFADKIAPIQEEIESFPHSLSDIVKMASLVELEAADYEVRRRIAGVLWKRIAEGMPLQVDAVFVSLLGKNTYELTRADLRVESPFNLHTNTGLPPRPIANPSVEAIRATINPIMTDDLYYLSNTRRNFYFAETLSEHNQNRRDFMDTPEN